MNCKTLFLSPARKKVSAAAWDSWITSPTSSWRLRNRYSAQQGVLHQDHKIKWPWSKWSKMAKMVKMIRIKFISTCEGFLDVWIDKCEHGSAFSIPLQGSYYTGEGGCRCSKMVKWENLIRNQVMKSYVLCVVADSLYFSMQANLSPVHRVGSCLLYELAPMISMERAWHLAFLLCLHNAFSSQGSRTQIWYGVND